MAVGNKMELTSSVKKVLPASCDYLVSIITYLHNSVLRIYEE